MCVCVCVCVCYLFGTFSSITTDLVGNSSSHVLMRSNVTSEIPVKIGGKEFTEVRLRLGMNWLWLGLGLGVMIGIGVRLGLGLEKNSMWCTRDTKQCCD